MMPTKAKEDRLGDLIPILSKTNNVHQNNNKLTVSQLIELQKNLFNRNITNIPTDYIELLHQINGFDYNGAKLFGILLSEDNQYLNILDKNLSHNQQDIILLGENELDLLAYNQKLQKYLIIDKDDMQTLYKYGDFIEAIKHILRLNNNF